MRKLNGTSQFGKAVASPADADRFNVVGYSGQAVSEMHVSKELPAPSLEECNLQVAQVLGVTHQLTFLTVGAAALPALPHR